MEKFSNFVKRLGISKCSTLVVTVYNIISFSTDVEIPKLYQQYVFCMTLVQIR